MNDDRSPAPTRGAWPALTKDPWTLPPQPLRRHRQTRLMVGATDRACWPSPFLDPPDDQDDLRHSSRVIGLATSAVGIASAVGDRWSWAA